MDPVTIGSGVSVLSESIDLLKAALDATPATGRTRRMQRSRRMEAYLAFQRAAHEASVWPAYLSVLEQIVRSKEATPDQLLPDLAAARNATAALLSALSEIRMVGNPEPRRLAEEIMMLLVELMEARLPGVPERNLRLRLAKRIYKFADHESHEKAMVIVRKWSPQLAERFDGVSALVDDDIRKTKEERFNSCQLALGTWHKKFTLAARRDLGCGPRRWHLSKKSRTARWQIWRPYEEWPGGWPPPSAEQLVAQAARERETRLAVRMRNQDMAASTNPDLLHSRSTAGL
jgi:hypothetical protein